MYCTNCGKEVTGKFCAHCGTRTGIENGQEISEPIQDVSKAEENQLGTEKPVWDAPPEFYKKYAKWYGVSPKHLELAIRLGIAERESDIVIYDGSYFPKVNNVIIFVKHNEVVILRVNDRKPERNIIKRFPKDSKEFASTYNPKKKDFEPNDLLGFKYSGITGVGGMNAAKYFVVIFEMLKLMNIEEAERYFNQRLIVTF